MSQIVGKWKSNNATRKNFDDFVKKTGVPAEYVEKYRNATIYVEYQHKGDNWTMITYSDVSPEIKTYSFQLGKELVTKDRQGKGVKLTCMVNPDGSWTDKSSSELIGWKETKTTRVVKGDKMFVTTETDQTSMSYEMDRQ